MTAPGVASHQATDRKERAPTGSVDPDSLIGVGGTRRNEATPGRAPHTVLLIDPDEREGRPSGDSWFPSSSFALRHGRALAHWRLGAAHRLAALSAWARLIALPPSPVTAPATLLPVAARRASVIAFLNSSNGSPAAPGPVLTR